MSKKQEGNNNDLTTDNSTSCSTLNAESSTDLAEKTSSATETVRI